MRVTLLHFYKKQPEKRPYIFTGYFMDGGATECKLLGNSEKLDQCSNQKQEIYFVWPNFKYRL